MRYDQKRIEDAVRPLVGLSLFAMNRAAYIHTFQFGTPRTVPSALAGRPDRIVGDYALHLQCPWRLIGANGQTIATPEGAHYIAVWLERQACTVATVTADERGGLGISLTHDLTLEVSPNADEDEHWRLLQPGRDAPHFVVTASGLED